MKTWIQVTLITKFPRVVHIYLTQSDHQKLVPSLSFITKYYYNYHDCINFAQDISVISMNVKQVYSEWYDTVSDNEIDSVCILREIIEVWERKAKSDIFNIDDVEFIINDLCVN